MAPVFAQMRGNAVGAGFLRQQRGAHRIGIVAAARIAHRGDMIDVDAEAELGHANPRLPGFTAGTLRRWGGKRSAGQAATFHSARAISGTPTLAVPPERSIKQQAATTFAPVFLIAVMHSRLETPVETISSTISTFWPFFKVKLRRSWNSPSTRSTYMAGRPSWRPISYPGTLPPPAGETMAVISSATSFFTFSASALQSLAVRLAS